jgi:hypothetical protein
MTLQDGNQRIGGVKETVTGITRKRIYSTKFITMGITSFICKEEGWQSPHVY